MTTLDTDVFVTRAAQAPADEQFIRRWSPRAFDGQALTKAELDQLFEAARWSPSCFNSQPWRFIYALRDTEHWQPLFELLVDANQEWAKQAGALIAVVSKTTFDNGDAAPTHSFDAGSAWLAMALQVQKMGLASHAMWGFHHDQAPDVLGLTDEYAVQAMVAVGHPGEITALPDKLQAREIPSPRKALSEIAMPGKLS
ncbi:MAG: nitroreductase family protein [Pseudomonadales bacterium]